MNSRSPPRHISETRNNTRADVNRHPQMASSSAPVLSPASVVTQELVHSSSLPSSQGNHRSRKASPLTSLLDTERAYVEILAGIIRKVAGAWTRANLPPHELDIMFRCIENIYKANRQFLSKLKTIGVSPASPEELGSLLISWVNDLEAPYNAYSTNFCIGFDSWDPAQCNERLRSALASFTTSLPPPSLPSSSSHPSDSFTWTLDALFLLPKERLQYYRTLYSRLLKNTTPGKNDHQLLSAALSKLDRLLEVLLTRAGTLVGAVDPQCPVEEQTSHPEVEEPRPSQLRKVPKYAVVRPSDSKNSQGRADSSLVPMEPEDAASPTVSDKPQPDTAVTIRDLERRLSTKRTVDILTMKPKHVHLQISPPSLSFTREERYSADVYIRFTPSSTGVELVKERGHLVILTDLLLICERIPVQEQGSIGLTGPDLSLLFPPLSGKHLRAVAMRDSDKGLLISVINKESLLIEAVSPIQRDRLAWEIEACTSASANLATMATKENISTPSQGLGQSHNSPMTHPPHSLSPNGVPHSLYTQLSTSSQGTSTVAPKTRMSPVPETSSDRTASRQDARSPPHSVIIRKEVPGHDSTSGQSLPDLSPRTSPRETHTTYTTRSASMPSTGQEVGHISHEQVRAPSFRPGDVVPAHIIYAGRIPPPSSMRPGQTVLGRPFGSGTGEPQSLPDLGWRSSNPREVPHPQRPVTPGGERHGYPTPKWLMSHDNLRQPSSEPALLRPMRPEHDRLLSSPPPLPPQSADQPHVRARSLSRATSSGSLHPSRARMYLPPQVPSLPMMSDAFVHSPQSPTEPMSPDVGPTTTALAAQMKCKVFLQQQHEQWKSLGAARLKLYLEQPSNVKQLVVEAENKERTLLISTLVLPDGVERVGRTGVAVELSDRGKRSGIVYMIQLRNEQSAGGLFDSLLAGSDRSVRC